LSSSPSSYHPSCCVRIDFAPLSLPVIVETLRAEGVPAELAHDLAVAAEGRLDRARLLAGDPEFASRRQMWQSIPTRLDGTGATAAKLAAELIESLEHSVAPLRTRQQEEVAELEARNTRMNQINGKPASGRAAAAGVRELEDRHKREVRRQRTDELKAGLAALAGVYRDRLVAGGPGAVGALDAIDLVQGTYANLEYNPNELLQLEALLVGLALLPAKTR
jgi:DNA polymerase-3 subunit delta'